MTQHTTKHPGSTAPPRPTEDPAPGEQAQPVAIPDETQERPAPPALEAWEPPAVRSVPLSTALQIYMDESSDGDDLLAENEMLLVRLNRSVRRAAHYRRRIAVLCRDDSKKQISDLLGGVVLLRRAFSEHGIVTGSLVERVHALAKRPAHLVEENRTLQAEIAALQRRVEELTRERCAGQEAS